MSLARRAGYTFALLALLSSIALGQGKTLPAAASDTLLSIGGEVERPLKVTAADLAKLSRRTVTAKDHDGKETSFEGVELGEVLKLADRRDGKPLPATEGPVRIVVPDEKRQARWVRQVTALTIRRADRTQPGADGHALRAPDRGTPVQRYEED